jgi:hypothetical protein
MTEDGPYIIVGFTSAGASSAVDFAEAASDAAALQAAEAFLILHTSSDSAEVWRDGRLVGRRNRAKSG